MKLNTLPGATRLGSCALLAAFAGLPLAASAADYGYDPAPAKSGFFIGAGAGSNSLNGQDYTGNGNHVDDSQVAYKGLVGYRLNEVVSLETQYVNFGTARGGNNTVKAHGVTAGGVFEAPITRFVHPYAKAQALFWDAEGSFDGNNRSDTGTDFAYGGGARFILGRHVDVRAEYERFEFQESDVHTISAMLQLNF
jgi:opacity protein-like surface antigen